MHYFDPASTSYQYQNAATPLVQGTAAMYLIGALILEVFPSDLLDDIDFFPFPTLHPAIPRAEEAPTNGFMAPRKVHNPAQTLDLLAFLGGDRAQEIYCEVAKGGAYPVSPTAHIPLTPLAVKGLDLLHNASALTQFFNRDSSDALQTTNYNAMEAFWENPANIDSILRTWQTAAQQVFAEQAKEGSLG
jgi:multiple sugar transport system substrate-binding protein